METSVIQDKLNERIGDRLWRAITCQHPFHLWLFGCVRKGACLCGLYKYARSRCRRYISCCVGVAPPTSPKFPSPQLPQRELSTNGLPLRQVSILRTLRKIHSSPAPIRSPL